MNIVTALSACAALTAMACTANAAGAPTELRNKTISVSFHVSNNGVDEQGRGTGDGRTYQQTIYISGQGRVFLRSDQTAGRYGKTRQLEPDRTAGEFRFQGNRLVRPHVGDFASGASYETISFDSGFQSCTASMQVGRQAGGVYKWKSLDGRNITATTVTVSTPTCSIREGNPFAQ